MGHRSMCYDCLDYCQCIKTQEPLLRTVTLFPKMLKNEFLQTNHLSQGVAHLFKKIRK